MVNHDAYLSAMKNAANAAWDGDWDHAIAEYRHAMELIPDDSQAMAGLALCLLEAKRYDEAVRTYERVGELVPGDPLPHEKVAEIYEFMGRTADAAVKYAYVGEIYFSRNDIGRALPNWQQAVHLDPNLPQPHLRLAVLYEKKRETLPHAIYEYLEVARLLQARGQNDRAEQALQRARKLDPLNSDVRNAQDDLKRGNPIQRAQPPDAAKAQPARKATGPLAPIEMIEEEEEHNRTPIGEGARAAMGVLAEMIWAGQVPDRAMLPLTQAMELHQGGIAEEALDAYKQALSAGFDHPALRLNMGLLYQHAHRPHEALPLLQQASSDPNYALAANLSMGLAYFDADDIPGAARYLVLALRDADLMLNQQPDKAGYDRVLSGLGGQPRDHLTEIVKSLAFALNDPNWRSKMSNALAGYAAQGKTSYVSDLMELLIEGGRPEIAEVMERVEMFLERNVLRLAMEEAHYAIERSPDYLPAHRRVADILRLEGRAQEAAFKLNLVAEVYMMRGNPEKAADLYSEVLKLWPADMGARTRVLDMLRTQGRVDDVLRHSQEMGDLYYRLHADPDKAISIYNEALTYGARHNASPEARIPILRSLADIESQRLNWREALSHYDKILDIAPEDEATTLAVIDLNFKMGEPDRAIKALDDYMRYCVQNKKMDRILPTLEEQVRKHPEEPAIRQRLSDVYRSQKRIPEAIAQLDALGEMFLDAGRKQDAIATIRKIVAMNPPDMESYRQLLEQLESGSPS